MLITFVMCFVKKSNCDRYVYKKFIMCILLENNKNLLKSWQEKKS